MSRQGKDADGDTYSSMSRASCGHYPLADCSVIEFIRLTKLYGFGQSIIPHALFSKWLYQITRALCVCLHNLMLEEQEDHISM